MIRSSLIIFVMAFTSQSVWATLCPWEVACEYKTKDSGSLSRLICRRITSDATYAGVTGEDIVKDICETDKTCFDLAMQTAPTKLETITGKNFSMTGLFCKRELDADNDLVISLFNPTTLQLNGQNYQVTKAVSVYNNTALKMLIPSADTATVTIPFASARPNGKVVCARDSYFAHWFELRLHDNGSFRGSSFEAETSFNTRYGIFNFLSAASYPDGSVSGGFIHGDKNYPVIVGGREFKFTYTITFFPSGSISFGSYIVKSAVYGVCFDESGKVTKEGDSLSLTACPKVQSL